MTVTRIGTSRWLRVVATINIGCCPSGRTGDCQRRIETWPHRTSYAVATVVLLALGLTYEVSLNVLVLTPLACLQIVGGQGCDGDEAGVVHNATPC